MGLYFKNTPYVYVYQYHKLIYLYLYTLKYIYIYIYIYIIWEELWEEMESESENYWEIGVMVFEELAWPIFNSESISSIFFNIFLRLRFQTQRFSFLRK
jgi:hypothetical protein